MSNEYLDQQYQEWLDSNPAFLNIDTEKLKERVGVFLKEVVNQPVQEYMLMRKYNQLHDIYEPEIVEDLFGEKRLSTPKGLTKAQIVKNQIWVPKHPDDYLELEPELILTNNDGKFNPIFNILRLFTSTGENNNNIGRNLYYVIRDKKTETYLGTLNLSSDYLDVRCRDEYIGWTREQRNGGRINHTSVGSIIVPTQPLGYNYVGGKLISLLAISDKVQSDWKSLYGDILVGVTTTSFYGTFSQYTGLKYWKSLGKSMGSSTARPHPELYMEIREWLKTNHTKRYFEWYHGKDENGQKVKRDHINRSMAFAYSQLGFKPKDYITGHQRGIHYCSLYTNTSEFLREDITENELVPRFDNSLNEMTNLWKSKYASKRIKNLMESGRGLSEVLFYDDLLSMTWDEAKEKYLSQVGR